MNLSVVIMYFTVDSITEAFSLPVRRFVPRWNVSTMIPSFWFNKTTFNVTNFIKKGFSFISIMLSLEKLFKYAELAALCGTDWNGSY